MNASILSPDTQRITYEFYVENEKVDSQIVVDSSKLFQPETPENKRNKKFIGWKIKNGDFLQFDEGHTITSTVNENNTIRVDAIFEDIAYIYFTYDNKVIATKESKIGGTITGENINFTINKPNKIFSHWSLEDNGIPFDFTSAINTDIKLYAVLKDAWKVNFNTGEDGTPIAPQYVEDGEKINTISPPSRVGYDFSHWSNTINGTAIDLNIPIKSDTDLFAVWKPKENTNYGILHWQENANDNEYSLKEVEWKTGRTDDEISYVPKFYEGFHHNVENSNKEIVTIKPDGSAIKNVYYDRNRWTLTFMDNDRNQIVQKYGQIKFGESTAPWWDLVSKDNPTWVWLTKKLVGSGYSVGYTLAPDMPNNDLTVWGKTLGNTMYTVKYIEDGTNLEIHKPYTWYDEANVSLTKEDHINFPGFTFKSQSKRIQLNGPKRYEWTLSYTRNKYNIIFQKNDLTNESITVNDIPYETSLSNIQVPNFEIDVTTRKDGYVFKGWFNNEATVGEPFTFDREKMPAGNLILFGKWEKPKVTVTVHHLPNEDTSTYDLHLNRGEKINENELIKEIPAGFEEKDFIGWHWYIDNKLVPYNFDRKVDFSFDLYPVWEDTKGYRVSYDLNGGYGNEIIDQTDYCRGASAAIKSPENIKAPEGKVFIGWKSTQDNKIYYPNEKLDIIGNMNLVAEWGDKVVNTKLIYYSNFSEGSNEDDIDSSISIILENNVEHKIQENTFKRNGYKFIGWNTEPDGSGTLYTPLPIDNPKGTVIINNEEPIPNKLYAQWEKIDTVNIPIEKKWIGKKLQEITIKLLANDQVIDQVVLNEKVEWKHIFKDLPLETSTGELITYTIQENEPDNYKVTIDESLIEGSRGFIITNTQILGSLKIIKVDGKKDKEGNELKLSGAEFELQNKSGQTIKDNEGNPIKGITNTNGEILFKNLEIGNYQLVETKAPTYSVLDREGNTIDERPYRILTKPIKFKIDKDGKIVTDYSNLIIENEEIIGLKIKNFKTGWELPITGGIGSIILYGLGTIIMLIGITLNRKTSIAKK